MEINLQLIPASEPDYPLLAVIGREAFAADKLAYGEGPEIYENPAFMLPLLRKADGSVRKLTADGELIGLVITYEKTETARWLGCICIHPAWQGRGYGLQAIRLLEAAYPAATQWGLDTPSASLKNRRFYEKAGYRATGEYEPREGFRLTLFEKRL